MAQADLSTELLSRARALALALPETSEVTTSFGANFKVRNRIFAHVLAIEDPDGVTHTMLVCRADPEEREVLAAIGHPYFVPQHGRDRIGVLLGPSSDWTELAELLTESYRILAPKKLAAAIEGPPAL